MLDAKGTRPTKWWIGQEVAPDSSVSSWSESCMILAEHGVVMPILTIRHITAYRYRQPVAFGEHRMMLRPRDAYDQRLLEANLEISPEPTSLRFVQDAFGNHLGIARFSGRSKELCFESIVCLRAFALGRRRPRPRGRRRDLSCRL